MVKEERGSKIHLRAAFIHLFAALLLYSVLYVPIINWKLSKREEEPTPMSQFVKGHLEKHKPYITHAFLPYFISMSQHC